MPTPRFIENSVEEDADSARLAQLAGQNDREAFVDITRRYFDRARRYAAVHVGDSQRAEKAALQAFAAAYDALQRGRNPSASIRPWLLAHVRAQAVGLRGAATPDLQESVRRDLAEAVKRAAPPSEHAPSDADLLARIESLPITHREALFLRFQVGLTDAELAKVVGRTAREAATLVKRALSALDRQAARGEQQGTGTRTDAKMSRRPHLRLVTQARRLALGTHNAGSARDPRER